MKESKFLRLPRIVVFSALALPVIILADDYLAGVLVSPFRTIVQETGTWAIRLLVLGLLIGPLRDFTGWMWPLALRRMIGLYAAFYAVVHIVAWARQYGFDWPFLLNEITRLWLLIGALAALALLPLAATSAGIMHRLLGPTLWGRIHKLVYAAATLAVIHYAMARGFTRNEVPIDIVLIGAALAWRKFAPKRPLNAAVARPSSPA